MTPTQAPTRPADRKPKATASPGPAPIIDIEAEDEDIPVRLVGMDYLAHRPKSMLAIRLGERINAQPIGDNLTELADSMREFMVLIFGTEQAPLIMDRLEDPDDRLDLPHLKRLVDRIVEVVTGRPPTSPSA